MQPMLKIIDSLKKTLICRDCNIEIDSEDDNPQHELTNHYNKFHIQLFVRCNKCLQRLYSVIILLIYVYTDVHTPNHLYIVILIMLILIHVLILLKMVILILKRLQMN